MLIMFYIKSICIYTIQFIVHTHVCMYVYRKKYYFNKIIQIQFNKNKQRKIQ